MVAGLPELLLVGSTVLLVWVGYLVAFGRLTGTLALTGVLVAVLGAALLRLPAPPRPSPVAALLALVAAVGFVAVNLRWASTELFLFRDPAVYGYTAAWLVDHSSVRIPLEGGSGSSVGYMVADGAAYPWWTHTLPAMGGLLGRVLGADAALQVNLVFGALAVLALFALARRVASDWSALLVAVAFGCSLPLVHFSRGMYSEVSVTVVDLVALSAAVASLKRRSWAASAVAGLALGAAAAGRIDGLLFAAVVLPAVVLVSRIVLDRRRREVAVQLLWVLPGLAAGVFAGRADIRLNAPQYADFHRSQLDLVAASFVVALVLCVLVTALPHRANGWVRRRVTSGRAPVILCAVVAVVLLVLLSRPIWDAAANMSFSNELVRIVQEREGLTVDGRRTYEEQMLPWLAAYLGWPSVLVALTGTVLMVYNGLVRRAGPSLLLAAVLLAFMVYLSLRSSITPDNVWAMRRFLSQVIPLLLVCAGWTVDRLWRHPGPSRVVAVVLSVSVFSLPLLATAPVFPYQEGRGQEELLDALCSRVDDGPVVVAGDNSVAGVLRVRCRVPVTVVGEPGPEQLAGAVRGLGEEEAVLVSTDPTSLWPGLEDAPPPSLTAEVSRLERTLKPPPRAIVQDSYTIWTGTVTDSGRVRIDR